jgi:hypothetical protein
LADTRTPAYWLENLNQRIDERWLGPVGRRRPTSMGVCDAYYEGDHNLTFANAQFFEAFGSTFRPPPDNWMQLIVDSRVERLEVQGFLIGRNGSADERAWEIWQNSGLDLQAGMAHEEAVKLGEAYWLVEPPAPGTDDPPTITCEHPSQTIVAVDRANRRRRLAALKKWVGEDGYLYANVYLPEGVAKYRSVEKAKAGRKPQFSRRTDDPGGPHDLGEVPVIPLMNRPSMLRGGQSDLPVAIPIQDAVTKLLADLLIGAEYQAWPQRVLLGVELPRDPVTGQPIPAAQIAAARSRLWNFMAGEGQQARVEQFDAASLDNYIKSREHLIKGMHAKTRTPPYYFTGEMVNIAAETIIALDAGLVSVVRKAGRSFGETHEDAVALSFKAMGDEQRAKAAKGAHTLWRNFEIRSEAQAMDAAVKLQSIGWPEEMVWEFAGMSPQQIARAKALKMVDNVFGDGEDDAGAGT